MDLAELDHPSGRGRALAALRRSEAFNRALLDASVDAIVAVDVHGRVLEFNAAAERLFGWARAEAFGRDIAELGIELRRAHAEGLTRLEVPVLRRRDGSTFDAELSIARAPELEPAVFVATVRDISERKRAEAERTALLRRDGALLSALGEIVYEWLPPEDKLHWRGDHERVLGYSAEEMGADTASWTSRVHPDDLPAVLAEVEDARRESRRYDLEYRFRHRDGHYVWMHDRGVLFVDERGELVRLIGVFLDVSERKRFERALIESEARFRSLSALSSDWLWETDVEHRFFGSAPLVSGITGYGAEHYVGKRRWEVAGLSPAAGDWSAHRALLERRESFRDFELLQVRPDGSRCYLQVSGEPVFDAAGAFVGYRGTAKDISARKNAEAAVRRLTRMHAALSALNELIPRVREAHELIERACKIVAGSGDFLDASVRMLDRAEVLAEEGGAPSTAVFPLRQGGAVAGTLLVRGASADAFDGDIRALLERMAETISYGLDFLETELRFRQTFERAGVGIAHVDLGGRFLRVNPSLCRMLGYSAQELAERTVKDVSHPEDRDLADEEMRRLRAGETASASLEKRYLRKDGSVVWAHLVIALARDAAGRVAYAISFAEDITARKAEERLLRLEHQVTLGFAEASSASQALRSAMRAICESENWEAARYLYIDEERGVARAGESWSIPDAARERYLQESRAMEYPRGYGLVGHVWATGEPLWVPDIAADPRVARPRLAAETGMRGSVVFPVHAAGKTIGILIFDSREVRKPDERLLRALRVIGGQIGLLMRRAQAEEALRESEARFRSLSQLSSDWFWETDAAHRFVSPPSRIVELTGFGPENYVGRARWEVEGLAPVSGDWSAHRAALERRESFRDLELMHRTRSGDRLYLQISGEPVHDAAGAFKGYRGTAKDITARKRYESHIEHLANHDSLTGLPNRTLLRDRVEQAIVHARRGGGSVALLFVDLDHFKLVNDSWGHLVGDALLLEAGARIRKSVRDGDTVARLGGDEFVVLLTGLQTGGDAAFVARKMAGALAEPFELDGHEFTMTASIGIGLYPGDGDDLESLLQCSDAAMYRAKDAGRNTFEYYSAEMGARARVRVDIESGLRLGLERNEFRLHYQPQVDLRTGRIDGFEALLRWQRPGHGMVSPGAFIPVAEETGLIIPLGEWALREACRQAAAWSAAGLGALKVSVNLSARQFWRGGVTEVVRAALAASGLPPSQLEVEITESVVARDLKQVMLSLEQLRRMGVAVAIDDFGTGYSSLAYLRSLPIQKLKIDKSFIDGIPSDPAAGALVAEMVRLAHVLSLEVVAEGVESAAQAAFLRQAGCEAMQGYVFSRPVSADDCASLLRAGRTFSFER